MIDFKTLKTLELDKILERVSAFAVSEKGKSIVRSTMPCESVAACERELTLTAEAYDVMYTYGVYPSLGIDDVTEALKISEKLSMLTMGELLRIADVLKVSRLVKAGILHIEARLPNLKAYAADLYVAPMLEKDITDSIISDTEMSDNASPELAAIRRNIKKANDKLRDKLNSYITSSEYSKYLQDNIITMREDRYVIPVKSDARGAIKGLIHDQSTSGQTVYIEPLAIVELNNELRSLVLDEQKEIEKILHQLTVRVGTDAKAFLQNFDIITEMDVVFARAIYSRDIRGTMPTVNENGLIDIRKGRHPLIPKEKVIPISVNLGKAFDILLITGPNTGGKTVTLKMTGLLCLMGMCGLFIPAASDSVIGFYPKIFCDIGDEQSIEQNLSTFSSHISNIVYILDRLDKDCLLLIDEIGVGTDPEEGAALAVAVTDYVKNSGARSVITTHYSSLKEYSYVTERVENACMDFNPTTYAPTYNLIIGIPGTSNALEISAALGMKPEIINAAKSGITREKRSFEEVIQSADFARRKAEDEAENNVRLNAELESARKALEQSKAELDATRQKLTVNARKEVKRMTENALGEVNKILDELKTIVDNPTEGSFFRAAKLRKQIEALDVEDEPETDKPETVEEPPSVGDWVFVTTLNSTAQLVEINKNNEYLVKLGGIKTRVRKKNVLKLKKQPEAQQEKKYQKKTPASRGLINTPLVSEINLIGQTCDEAIYNLEKYIDSCKLSGLSSVRIIHGKGTGRLRAAVWEYLNDAGVLEYRLGKYGEGGDGVTVARLL